MSEQRLAKQGGEYRERVRCYLGMDELDEYLVNLCNYYMARGIPAAIAAQNARIALELSPTV